MKFSACFRTLLGVALISAAICLPAAAQAPEARNITLLAQLDLNGNGDGGEGMVVQQRPDGQRLLYFAHEGEKSCLSIIDVTNPEKPVLINTLPSPAPGVTRCNSLGLSGNVLAVANQTKTKGKQSAGIWLLDVSKPESLRMAKSLEDLKLSFFDTSGVNSRGVHCLWFVDGEFVHLTTGMADFKPTHPNDDQFYMIVDVRDPKHPHEVGRWWYPGTREGDACLPGCLPVRLPIDGGYRPHQTEVWPERPDRAYLGYIDGGAFILDISGLADVKAGRAKSFTPKVVSHTVFAPPFPGFTHSYQPIFSRGLAFVSAESITSAGPNCADAPKLVWLLDIRAESHPMIIDTAPLHPTDGDICLRGRFGAHNLQPNFPQPTSANLKNTTVATWFDGGVRIYHIVDGPTGYPHAPAHVEEIGYYMAAGIGPNPVSWAQMNHAIVDEKGIIYAQERLRGGLYILKYTGAVPLD